MTHCLNKSKVSQIDNILIKFIEDNKDASPEFTTANFDDPLDNGVFLSSWKMHIYLQEKMK